MISLPPPQNDHEPVVAMVQPATHPKTGTRIEVHDWMGRIATAILAELDSYPKKDEEAQRNAIKQQKDLLAQPGILKISSLDVEKYIAEFGGQNEVFTETLKMICSVRMAVEKTVGLLNSVKRTTSQHETSGRFGMPEIERALKGDWARSSI